MSKNKRLNLVNNINRFLDHRKLLLHFLARSILGNAGLFWLIGYQYLNITLSNINLYSHYISKIIIIIFNLISYTGHLALLAALPSLIFILPLILAFNRPWLIIITTTLVNTISLALLFTDSSIFSIFHFHLNFVFLKIMVSHYPYLNTFLNLSHRELTLIISVLLIFLGLEIFISVLIWKKITASPSLFFKRGIFQCLAGCLLGSYFLLLVSIAYNTNMLAHNTPYLPLYNEILAQWLPFKTSLYDIERFSETHFLQPKLPTQALHYPLKPLLCQPQKNPQNIVIIVIDSWRFDALNRTLTPNIEQLAKKSWVFQQHYSGGNSTQAGLFSLFYSLPSNYWESMKIQHQSPLFIDALLKNKYQTKILVSAGVVMPAFDQTIFQSIKNIKNIPGRQAFERDQYLKKGLQEFLASKNNQQPFFSLLFYDATHAYCQKQDFPKLFPTTDGECERLIVTPASKPKESYHRYQNAVHFIDQEIGQVLALLKKNHALENTIVIITGDHGEEFNDNHQNYWGHSSNYTHYQVQTPLIISWPGKTAKVFSLQTTHYDLAPYLLKNVLGCQNDFNDYSLSQGLFNKNKQPYIIVGSYINMGIIDIHRSLNTTLFASGNIRVANQNAIDLPEEKPDLNILSSAFYEMQRFYEKEGDPR